jgi:predicted MFS family arabinose efflux permease
MTHATTAGEERLLRGYSGRIVVALSLGWLTTQLGRFLLPPLLPAIIDDLSISAAEAGLALTLMWGSYAGVQYLGGRLSDGVGRKTVIVGGLTTLLGGFGLVTLARTYPWLLAALTLAGLGAGLYFVPSQALLSDLFVTRRGQALGINSGAGMLGSTLAVGVAVVALGAATWRESFLPVVVGFLGVLALVHRWARGTYAVEWVEMDVPSTVRRVFSRRRVVGLVVVYALFSFGFQAVISFYPTFLQVERGFSPEAASLALAVVFAVGFVAMPAAGNLGDRFSRVGVARVSLSLAILGLVGIVGGGSTPAVVASTVVFAAGMSAFPPLMMAHVMGHFSDASMGGDFGAFRTVYMLIGSLGPTYVGVVADAVDFETALWSVVPILVVGLVLLVLLGRR